MFDVMMWLIVIPVIAYALRFWWGVAKWVIRNKKTLGGRVQRVRSAFDEGSRREE
jgi:hypothetical protein